MGAKIVRVQPTSVGQVYLKIRSLTTFYYVILAVSIISIFKIDKVGSGGDFQYYIRNGKLIADGINPYLGEFRSGTFGPVALYFLSKTTPSNFLQSLFFVLNLLGIFSILFYFKSKLTRNALLISFIFALWSAPYREIVIDGQITSLLYLLIFSSLLLLRRKIQTSGRFIHVATAGFLSAIAIDLKPHICLPIIFFVGLAQRKIGYLSSVLIILVTFHALIDVKLGRVTEVEWLRNLIGVQSSKDYSNWPEQYNIWPVLDYLIPGYITWKIISIICMVVIFAVLVFLSLYKKELSIWFITASLSMVIPYSQLYSLTLLVVITMVHIVSKKLNYAAFLFVSFVLIPRYWTEPKNMIFVLLFLIIFSAFDVINKRNSFLRILKSIAVGTLLNVVIHAWNDNLNMSEDLKRSLICIEVTLLSMMYLLSAKKSFQSTKSVASLGSVDLDDR
jgi:hypothetical protein